MAQTLNLTYGRVKFAAGKPVQTTYGLRINAVVSLPSGEEVKLWGDRTGSIFLERTGIVGSERPKFIETRAIDTYDRKLN
jgi:hypothetical protein